jgi:tRNA threonylcarbamoyl adenosine modification protein YjeE
VTCLVVPTRDAMHHLGERLAGLLRAGDLVVLSGGLGAGKTTLVQGIGRGLQVRGDVTSPTFVIARVHPSLVGGPALVHVDAYRLASLAEVDDLDLDTSLAGSVTVVEWGEERVEGLADDRLLVGLERPTGTRATDEEDGDRATPDAPASEEPRTVTVVGVGRRWDTVDLDALLVEDGAA